MKIRQLASMLDDALILTDFGGVITSTNSVAVRWLGENLTGRNICDLIDRNDLMLLLNKAVSGTKFTEFVYEPKSIVDQQFKVRLKRVGKNLVAFLFLDMTLQRNLENVRRDFVANVSHELRSPLTSLAGFVETMLEGDIHDQEMQKRFLGIMDEEAKRMSRLIDDLLSLSRVEVEEHIVPEEIININQLLSGVCDSLAGQALKKNMSIKFKMSQRTDKNHDDEERDAVDAIRPLIFGNHDEITEVFVNLIENAIKYGYEGSEIILSAQFIDPGKVEVDVINFGEGIEERHISRVTERFYRVDKARSRQIGGTGLGLAIVKHIINKHRGHLSIESKLNDVTKFSVAFPTVPVSKITNDFIS